MAEDFFSKLDKRIQAKKEEGSARSERLQDSLSFAEMAMIDMKQVAEDYRSELERRGISANVVANGQSVSFRLTWGNGAEHTALFSTSPDTGRIFIKHRSFDRKSERPFESTVATTYDSKNWSIDVFKNELNSLIEEYVDASDIFGGMT